MFGVTVGARRARCAVSLAALLLAVGSLVGCGGGRDAPGPVGSDQPGGGTGATSATAAETAGPSPADTASPATPTPGGTPDGTTGSATPGGTASPVSASPLSCTSILPRSLGRVRVDPSRTTEVSTVASDGRTLTPGSSQQTEFAEPRLTGPDGVIVNDPNNIALIVDLLEKDRRQVLTTRPDAPENRADVGKRPFDAPGTYVLYNASGLMTAQIVVLCSGQQQTWQFEAEANPVRGTINCAVEPSRSNALARSVYQTNC